MKKQKNLNVHSDDLPFVLYYEFRPELEHVFGCAYLFQRVADLRRSNYGDLKPMQYADRVWKLTNDGTVTFIKHRQTGIMTAVDMKEFALVQYAASCYKRRDD